MAEEVFRQFISNKVYNYCARRFVRHCKHFLFMYTDRKRCNSPRYCIEVERELLKELKSINDSSDTVLDVVIEFVRSNQ
jgi:hypothetical protein